MKHMRKILALVLAMTMVLAMSVTAFAADDTTYKIEVDTSGNKADHTYKIYQIFTGTPDEGTLVDVRYGASYWPGGAAAGELVPGAELKAIADAADARAWMEANNNKLGDPVATLDKTTTSYDAVPGWYVVLDTNYEYPDPREIDDTDAYSAYMVEVVDKDTKIKPKSVSPTVDKEVHDETEDAEAGAKDGWGESADHEIGETFQFRLTANLPADADYSAYKEYPITFNDSMSEGVTFESIESVTVDGTAITDYECTATEGQAGGSWTLTIEDVKAIDGVDLTDGADVVVVYNAHLNTNAIVHQESATDTETNNNKVSLTYNNNPDATGEGETDTTPEDYVWVFTYNVTGNKVDADGEPVEGAGFTLYDSEGTAIDLYKVGATYYKYYESKTDYPTGGQKVTEMVTTKEANTFDIRGLDVGTYTLKETTVPKGYNPCADITVKIEATHVENSGLTSADLDMDKSENLDNTIVNHSGSVLPETGGIGTKMFYIVGAILVIGAGIVLVTRRRMSS